MSNATNSNIVYSSTSTFGVTCSTLRLPLDLDLDLSNCPAGAVNQRKVRRFERG